MTPIYAAAAHDEADRLLIRNETLYEIDPPLRARTAQACAAARLDLDI